MFNLLLDIDSFKFWEGAKKNKLLIQKSTISKKYFLYSRSFSGVAADESFEWVESSGKGTIYSFTISHIAGGSEFYVNKTPYIVASILLDEGVRLMSNIVDCDHSIVEIGKNVKVVFKKLDSDLVFPCFTIV
ncbi:MAG: hypothetical protein CBC53_005205 [Alphaproteobacteria bacterium TMED93]|nr:MAG: hypothetical protein CBC53_005205 [Alphaproteobacteria bacterium TMED93]